MCKIAVVAGIDKTKIEETWFFMQYLGALISVANSDGLGYSAITSKGKLFGERWLVNNEAFRNPESDEVMQKIYEQMKDVITPTETYNFFGDVQKEDVSSIVLHARMATCGRGLENTHPFIDDKDAPKVALIHNGHINNHMRFNKKYSTCDSEVILTKYLEEGVTENPEKIQDVSNHLSGWFAAAVANVSAKKPFVDVFTDGTRLSYGFIPALNTGVYTTSIEDLKTVCKEIGILFNKVDLYKPQALSTLKKGVLIRLDAHTGEIINKAKFNPDKFVYTRRRGGGGDDNDGGLLDGDQTWLNQYWWRRHGHSI